MKEEEEMECDGVQAESYIIMVPSMKDNSNKICARGEVLSL
jgi:hypothetical protein